jgi:flagellar export protein FliJ
VRALRFGLARVLRVRVIEEELARGAWQPAERAAQDAEAAAGATLEEIARSEERLAREQAGGRISPAEVVLFGNALDALRRVLAHQRRSAKARRAEAARLRQAWEAARARMRGLERLEQRERAQHRADLEAGELREIDEQALRRVSRSPAAPWHPNEDSR